MPPGRETMGSHAIDRRGMLAGATIMAATTLLPRETVAQGAASPSAAAAAPTGAEFIVRGALVLTMDPALGDLARGDVHVRDGAIVAVGASVPAPNAGVEIIDGDGMICM